MLFSQNPNGAIIEGQGVKGRPPRNDPGNQSRKQAPGQHQRQSNRGRHTPAVSGVSDVAQSLSSITFYSSNHNEAPPQG